MWHFRFAFFLFIFSLTVNGQIAIRTNLPEQMELNKEILLEVKIQKGSIKNFSKYQLMVTDGIEIKEVDSKTGTFTFENNRAQIIWSMTPPENELVVSMKFVSGNLKGVKTLNQKFFYLEKGEKREIETQPISILVDDFQTSNDTIITEEVPQKTLASLPTIKDSLTGGSENLDEVKQQINQLRNDSKEAYEIGGREKQHAEARIMEADKAIKKAATLPNAKEKKLATDKALAAKKTAQNDLEVAKRILSLAKSLEDNATEIEKLNQSIDSIGVGNYKTSTKNNGVIESNSNENMAQEVNSPAYEKDKKTAIKIGEKDAKGLYKPYSAATHNLSEIQQQVMQIKRDSKQAFEVGEIEKKKAEIKLAQAHQDLKMAGYMPEVEEKKIAIDKANADRLKAEKDLEIATKILVLAKSLESNANDIEKFNLPPKVEEPVAANPNAIPESIKNVILDIPKENEVIQPEKIVKKAEQKVPETKTNSVIVNKGLVFRIQVGSFVKTPNKADFKPIGKVDVVTENGMFKALYGAFSTREEATKQKQYIISKGFDGFIVSYQDGVRVK